MASLMTALRQLPQEEECRDDDIMFANNNSIIINRTSDDEFQTSILPSVVPTQQQSSTNTTTSSSSTISSSLFDDDNNNNNNNGDVSSEDYFKPGSIVELHTDTSYFATPAVITGQQHDDSSSSEPYQLLDVFHNTALTKINKHYIHPYQIYNDQTRASCSVGVDRGTRMTPCVVESHRMSSDNGGVVVYQVSYLNEEEDDLIRVELPFSRVRRVHARENGVGRPQEQRSQPSQPQPIL